MLILHVHILCFCTDFAVGAPYTENNGNTGAIYIYYGNSNQTLFESQTPFEVRTESTVLWLHWSAHIILSPSLPPSPSPSPSLSVAQITASDVVNNITGLNELKTFGYSVSGGVDVDNNRFNGMHVNYAFILYIHNVQKDYYNNVHVQCMLNYYVHVHMYVRMQVQYISLVFLQILLLELMRVNWLFC